MGLLLNQMGVLITEDTEKVESTNAFFVSVFTAEVSPQESQTLDVRKGQRKEDFHLVIEGWVRNWLGSLNTHKSMVSDGLHPWVLRELADVYLPLFIIEKSWGTGKVSDDWRKVRVTVIFKKGKKGDLGNYEPVSLNSIPGKVMK